MMVRSSVLAAFCISIAVRTSFAQATATADAAIHLVPGAAHGYATPANAWPDAEKSTFDWLAQHDIIPAIPTTTSNPSR
jgi:hypothetical protein